MEAKATLEKNVATFDIIMMILMLLIIIKEGQMLYMKIDNMVVDFMYEPITYIYMSI